MAVNSNGNFYGIPYQFYSNSHGKVSAKKVEIQHCLSYPLF